MNESRNSNNPESSGSNPGQRSSRSTNRGGRGNKKWNRNKYSKNGFSGKTKEMNGHVFQLQVEQRKKGQYQETMEQLHVYASNTYKKEIKHLKVLFTQLKKPTIIKPEQDKESELYDETIYKEEVRQSIKDKRSLESTLVALYNVVWGQCSKLLQNKLKASPKFTTFDDESDVIMLLTEVKRLSSKYEENTSAYDTLHEAKAKLFKYQQSDDESLADHMTNFKDLCSNIEYYSGDLFFDIDMVETEIREDIKNNVTTKKDRNEYRFRVVERAKAIAFIKCANRKRYGRLLSSIRQQHSFKNDVYPRTLADAYEMLSSHTSPNEDGGSKNKKENKAVNNANTDTSRSATNDTTNNNTGSSYLQTAAVPGTDGRLIPHITCFRCNKKGHYSDNCPEEQAEEQQQHIQTNERGHDDNNDEMSSEYGNEQHLQILDDNNEGSDKAIVHFSWTQVGQTKVQNYSDTDILLDTGSIFSVFKNQEMVLNIRNSEHMLKAYTNGGRQDSNLVADLPGFFTV